MCLSACRRLLQAQTRVRESLIYYCLRRDLLVQSGDEFVLSAEGRPGFAGMTLEMAPSASSIS